MAGDQVYDVPPAAVSGRLLPLHKPVDVALMANARFVTVTAAVVVLIQPLLLPVIVYVMLDEGVAVAVLPVVVLNAVDGDHE